MANEKVTVVGMGDILILGFNYVGKPFWKGARIRLQSLQKLDPTLQKKKRIQPIPNVGFSRYLMIKIVDGSQNNWDILTELLLWST